MSLKIFWYVIFINYLFVYWFLWPLRLVWLLVCCLYKEVYLQIFLMCVLLITRLLRLVGRWARKPVNDTSWVALITQTDRPKSVRNRCSIELFCGVVCVVTCPFDISVGVGAFVIGLGQISSFLSWIQYYCLNDIIDYTVHLILTTFSHQQIFFLSSPYGLVPILISNNLSDLYRAQEYYLQSFSIFLYMKITQTKWRCSQVLRSTSVDS